MAKQKGKKLINQEKHSHKISTLDLIKKYLAAKLPNQKQSLVNPNKSTMPSDIIVNHIAVVLDGQVEEVLRAQNRLAALLLSNPEFIEFDPKEIYPKVGKTKYINGKFQELDENNTPSVGNEQSSNENKKDNI